MGFLLSIILIVITAFFILFSYHSLPPLVPVFTQLPWGTQRLGVTASIFLPVGFALCISIVNMVISSRVYEKIPLISRLLALTAFLSTILCSIFVARTIFLVL